MRKNVLILAIADLRHMTAAGYYYYYLYHNNIEFDIVCTNRYGSDSIIEYPCQIYAYKWISSTYQSKIKKVIPMLQFREYAIRKMNENKYSYIIVWGENTGILFGNYLKKRYKGNYCINIRDIDIFKTLKIGKILYMIEQKTIKYAQFYTVPAPGGLIFSHKNSLIFLNKDYATLKNSKSKENLKNLKNEPLIITYMGLINQYYDFFIKVVKVLANDKRYLIRFYGDGAERIQHYISQNKICNIETKGTFPANETSKYLNETDIIFSAYGKTNYSVTDAIGVKESYGPQLRIPVISDNYGKWYEIAQKYGFGYGIDEEHMERLPDELFAWYNNLDFKTFETGCKKYCDIVDENNKKVWKLLDYKVTDKKGR